MVDNISIYKNAKDNIGELTSISTVLRAIRDGRYKEVVEKLRSLSKEDYDKSKSTELVGVTFSGSFSVRNKTNIVTYSSIICMDFDKMEESLLKSLTTALKADPLTFALFRSPSNMGIKVLVKVNITEHYHEDAWNKLFWYFLKKHGVKADVSGKDVSRLCFVSWDQDLYYNGNSRVFTIGSLSKEPIKDTNKLFDIATKWTEKKFSFTENYRNNYIHLLACTLNRFGIAKEEAERLIGTIPGIDNALWKEYERTIKSAYDNVADRGKLTIYERSSPTQYSDNLAEDEIVRSTIDLMRLKVPPALIKELMEYKMFKYLPAGDSNVTPEDVGMGEGWLKKVLNKSHNIFINNLRETVSAKRLGTVETVMIEALKKNSGQVISTGIPEFDDILGGGVEAGNVYGLVGHPGTGKSIFALFISILSAVNNIPCVYWNGEMGELQMLRRIIKNTLGIDIKEMMDSGAITPEIITDLTNKVKDKLRNNFYLISESGFSAKDIVSHIDLIEQEHKKKIKLVIVDGITHMEDMKNDEIFSAIQNSKELKESAKISNVAIIVLVHLNTGSDKHFRNASKFTRGGIKMIANMDGHFSTSLCIDPVSTNFDVNDIKYINNIFYIRCEDKRNSGMIADKIITTRDPLIIEVDPRIPKSFDIDMKIKPSH